MEKQNLITNGTFWLPEYISELSVNSDKLFYFILYGSVVLFVLIMIVILWFSWKYRRTETHQKASDQIIHNTSIEIAWTVIPLLLVMFVFAWGFRDYLRVTIPPSNTMNIDIKGQKWQWTMNYSDYNIKIESSNLIVPKGVPIKLKMQSIDVLHSFFIPNLRVKKDVLPNRYTYIWFQSDKIGNYHIYCTEYCGDNHSLMVSTLKVLSDEDFDDWISSKKQEASENLSPIDLGKKLYASKGCNACHLLTDKRSLGPGWANLYESERELTDGTKVVADDNYLRESILNPNVKIVNTYVGMMPPYAGQLTEDEINSLISFIKTLR